MKRTCLVAVFMLALATVVQPGFAEPSVRELRSLRAIVPDYSETSGGMSPALSPDGKALAFVSHNIGSPEGDDIRIMTDLDVFPKHPRLWTMDYKLATVSRRVARHIDEAREIDWSPDGKKLAFIGKKDGVLYVAEGVDAGANTVGAVRSQAYPGDSPALSLSIPRWSPDGKHIAFVRRMKDRPSQACMLDTETGSETVLTSDAMDSPYTWEQPWSPDGRFLAYAIGHYEQPYYLVYSDYSYPQASSRVDASKICIRSLDGDQQWSLRADGGSGRPDWSKAGRIAFFSPRKCTVDYSQKTKGLGLTYLVGTADPWGLNVSSLTTQWKPDADASASLGLRLAARERQEFWKQFGPKLTTSQAARFKAGTMTQREMRVIAIEAAAERIGGHVGSMIKAESQRLAESRLAMSERLGREFRAMTSEQFVEFYKVARGYSDAASLDATVEADQPGHDDEPTWSPDGKRIAYVHRVHDGYTDRLYLIDAAGGRKRLLFSASDINCVSWSADSKTILIQADHVAFYRGDKNSTSWSMSYPQIWMLEPK